MAEPAERPAARVKPEVTAPEADARRHEALERRSGDGAYATLLNGRPAGSRPVQKPNRTGLPDRLKAGLEALSGVAMDDVRVHYNSSRPAKLDALAYAQGRDIHLAPGQQRHLPHEAWHVVQQKQGRVRPNMQLKGGPQVNDDAALEQEADVMGRRSAAGPAGHAHGPLEGPEPSSVAMPVQRLVTPAELELMNDEEVQALLETLSYAELSALHQSLVQKAPVTAPEELKSAETGLPKPSAETTPSTGSSAEAMSNSAEASSVADTKKIAHRHFEAVDRYRASVRTTINKEIGHFAKTLGYTGGRTQDVNPFFGNLTLTLYPVQDKNPTQDRKSVDDRVHRPILEVEIVHRAPYARAFLGLFAPDPEGLHKDITADDTGKVTLRKVNLMNLGNPMKALLWCEDYLSNAEHYRKAHEKDVPAEARPVVRSFLVPLSDAQDLMLSQNAFADTRPLDQDRGSGQFGNRGDLEIYDKIMHPLIGSLVSFFHSFKDYEAAGDKGQRKFALADLQEYLTGQYGDPRKMAAGEITKEGKQPTIKKGGGMAAQHQRGDYKVSFRPAYQDALTAYYNSVQTKGPEPVAGSEGAKGGKGAKSIKSPMSAASPTSAASSKSAANAKSAESARSTKSTKSVKGAGVAKDAKAKGAVEKVEDIVEDLEGTGFSSAVSGDKTDHRHSKIPKQLDQFPRVKKKAAELTPAELAVKYDAFAQYAEPQPPTGAVLKLRAFAQAYRDLRVERAQETVQPSHALSEEAGDEEERKEHLSESESSMPEAEADIFENQYAGVENVVGLPANWFVLLKNTGGGDCLYHAAEGKTLSSLEVASVRADVANIIAGQPDDDRGLTRNANIAAATISQSPVLADLVGDIAGRDAVPNAVLAKMQEIPQVYAGPEELAQWCELKDTHVYVIDQDGTVARYSAGGASEVWKFKDTVEDRARIRQLAANNKTLYKSWNHWELVEGLSDAFPDSG